MRILGRLLLAGSLGLGAACQSPERPDVLLVTVDTLRADHVGAYGSTTTQTPEIDRWAAEGTRFQGAVAPLPETRPSHFTLFTSRYPRDHGVVSNTATLAEDAVTLAEVYSQEGYRTAAFVGTILLDRGSGAGQGFEVLDAGEEPQRPAREVLSGLESYLATASREAPLFLWVHLFDPHMPYEPEGWEGRGQDPEWTRRLPMFTWPRLFELADARDGDLPAGAVARGRELYGGEVEVVDAALERLRHLLEHRGRWAQTVAALTSDHGECFERGVYFEHSHCLGEGALAAPLILRGPGVPVTVVDSVTEHLDVAPTLLALSGIETPVEFQGRDLFDPSVVDPEPFAFFQHPVYPQEQIDNRRDVLQRFQSAGGEPTRPLLGDRLEVGARSGRWKYLRVGDREHLYDLDEPAAEDHDLSGDQEEVLRRLRRATREWLRDHPLREVENGAINPELREQLEALGYLGG